MVQSSWELEKKITINQFLFFSSYPLVTVLAQNSAIFLLIIYYINILCFNVRYIMIVTRCTAFCTARCQEFINVCDVRRPTIWSFCALRRLAYSKSLNRNRFQEDQSRLRNLCKNSFFFLFVLFVGCFMMNSLDDRVYVSVTHRRDKSCMLSISKYHLLFEE